MSERRIEATVIGPGASGFLKIAIGTGQAQFVTDVPAERLPASLRLPNAQFVAAVEGRELVRVETVGTIWLNIQDQIRLVLNDSWDPIGVAGDVPDEYDGYIADLYTLLQRDKADEPIIQHLRGIEADRMGLTTSSRERLQEVVRKLRQLRLPSLTV